jgi:hypothetical protein
MNNRSSKYLIHNERGTLTGFPLVLLTLILVVAVLGLLAHWFLSGPSTSSVVEVQPAVRPTPIVPAGKTPITLPSVSVDEALWKVLDDQVQKMDLAKLQVRTEIDRRKERGYPC